MHQTKAAVPAIVPIEIVDAPKVEEIRTIEIALLQRRSRPPNCRESRAKVLSKPTIFETPTTIPIGNTKQEIKEPDKLQ